MYNMFMNIENVKTELETRLLGAPPIGATVKITIPEDGHLLIDGATNAITLGGDQDGAETTLICSAEVMNKIAQGTQDPTMAYMTGKLKVQGTMGYALKLASLLED